MDPLTRENVRAVLGRFDISSAWRAADTDPSEEVILIATTDFERVDAAAVALAIMDVVQHTKVWVIEVGSAWNTEPL